jgi:anti-sigma regulatory factor (Ser/Thr protein kinase)
MNEERIDSASPVTLGKLSVPVDMAYLPAAQAFTVEIAKVLSFNELETNRLQLAVEEAFANAVQHFDRTPGREEAVHIEYVLAGEALTISLRDRGAPFDIDEVDRYEKSDADAPGLGLTLMKKSVDAVELIAGASGKELRLTKFIPPDAELPAHIFRTGSARKKSRVLDPERLKIRYPAPEDLAAIRRLAWKAAGYGEADAFFDLALLRGMLESRSYVPVAAFEPESGAAVHHMALSLDAPWDAVPLAGMEFADPDFSCPGLAQKTTLILFEIARRMGFAGVRSEASAASPAELRAAGEWPGAAPCAVLVNAARGGRGAAGLALSCYAPIGKNPATVHVPPAFFDAAKAIYAALALPRTVKSGADAPVPARSQIAVRETPARRTASISVTVPGLGCVEEIHAHLNRLRASGTEVIRLLLAAESPAAPEVAASCAKLGLVLSGILPGHFAGRDALLLQWAGVPLDTTARIADKRGEALFREVVADLGY